MVITARFFGISQCSKFIEQKLFHHRFIIFQQMETVVAETPCITSKKKKKKTVRLLITVALLVPSALVSTVSLCAVYYTT